jgi:hypothetical protein
MINSKSGRRTAALAGVEPINLTARKQLPFLAIQS